MKIVLAIDKKITIFAKNIIMTNEDFDRNLVKSIKDNKLVIFVGAGVTTYLGMPSWRDFARNCFKELSKNNRIYNNFLKLLDDEKVKPSDILDNIKDEKDRTMVKNLVLEKFKVSPGADCWYHKRLLLLSSKIITTNFDDAFEVAFRQLYKKQITVGIPKINNVAFSKNRDNLIIKLHGCTSSPDHCAIFSDDYTNIYKKNKCSSKILEQYLREYDFLFIGYSFCDEIIVKLIQKEYGTTNRKNYLLTNTPAAYTHFDFLEPRTLDYNKQKTLDYLDSLIYKAHGRRNDKSLSKTLAAIDLFSGIDPTSIFYQIVREAKKKTLRKGDYLCHADEVVNSFWIIVSGKIAVKKNGDINIFRSASSPIGELGFLHNWKEKEDNQIRRSSDLIATEDNTIVLEINQELINKLEYKDQMTFWTNFAKVLANKLREANYDII